MYIPGSLQHHRTLHNRWYQVRIGDTVFSTIRRVLVRVGWIGRQGRVGARDNQKWPVALVYVSAHRGL